MYQLSQQNAVSFRGGGSIGNHPVIQNQMHSEILQVQSPTESSV